MIGYSTVTQKGQITIPVDIRQNLGLLPKTRVVVIQEADGAKIKPETDLLALRGSIAPKSKPENFKQMRREFIRYLSGRKKFDPNAKV